ncbi:hypothetical protein ACFW1P_08045 [Paenibacillus sp. NPDC058910]
MEPYARVFSLAVIANDITGSTNVSSHDPLLNGQKDVSISTYATMMETS